MLSFENLDVKIAGKTLLQNLTGSIPPGKVVGLVAPNGSGKTTFMRGLIGAHKVKTKGNIAADGIDLTEEQDYRRLVFYVPGDASSLYPLMSVRANLMFVKRCWGSTYDIDELAKRCHIDGFMNKLVRQLSLGMKQQVCLCAGYMTEAKYLLLDEPMNALDPSNVEINASIIRKLCNKGAGVVMSSHILESVDDISDKVWFIKDKAFIQPQQIGETSRETYKKLYG